MELIKPNFKFKVVGEGSLAASDMQSLTLLYQPIIGLDAFSLYTTLTTLLQGTCHSHHMLLQIFGFSMEQLVNSRHRLEAVGLIDVYESDELLTYRLKKPLSADKFFSDGIMSAFLYVKIGSKDFASIKRMVVSEHAALKGTKVSKRFDEVFEIKKLARVPQNLVSQHYDETRVGIDLSANFDQLAFTAILVKKGISQEIITQDLLTVLNELAFLYKFDVHELARIVFDSLDPAGVVDYLKMKSLARIHFQLMNKGEHVQVVVKDEKCENNDAIVENKGDQSKQAILAFLEQNPIDFLRFKSGGKPPVPADVKLVEWLYLDQGMNPGVVNVLMDYVLDYTDGNLPKQLVEKMAGQWQRQGIITTEAAMKKVVDFLKKSKDYKKEKQTPSLKYVTRSEPIPEWLGKDQKSNNSEEDVVAKERIEQMKREMMNGGER